MKAGLLIFISSFLVQASVIFFSGSYHHPQLYEFEQIAINLLSRHTFVCHRLGSLYYSLVPPVYPAICAAVYYLTNYSHLAMLFTQAVFISLLCLTLYALGKDVFNEKIGLISAFLCMFHPGLVFFSTVKIHELSLVSLLFTLIIFAAVKFQQRLTCFSCFILGLLFGITILTRATIVLFLPLFLAWLCLKSPVNLRRNNILKSFFIIIIASLAIAPWLIRNYSIHHKFVFMQTPSVDLWVGNNLNASGGNYLKNGKLVLDSMPKEFIEKVRSADELKKDKIFKDAFFEFITEHPYRFSHLFLKKFYYFWYFAPYSGAEYPRLYLYVYKFIYTILLLSGIIGIILGLRSKQAKERDFTHLTLLLFLAISLFQSLFYVEGRHRWAIEPLLLIFSANGALYIKGLIKKNRINIC